MATFPSLLLAFVIAHAGDTTPAPGARPEPQARPASDAKAKGWTLAEILDALRVVETGGEKDGGRHSNGDSGGAIGPFQIHRAYWIDSRVPGRWEDCRDPGYARTVVVAYWRRYCSKALDALDAETLARVHNGGPDGAREKATLKFWAKVERELARQRAAREAERAAREAAARRGAGRPAPASGGRGDARPAPKPPQKRDGWV